MFQSAAAACRPPAIRLKRLPAPIPSPLSAARVSDDMPYGGSMRPDRAAVNDLQCEAGSRRGIRRLLPTPAADTSTRDSCRATRFSRAPAAFRPAGAATPSSGPGARPRRRRRFGATSLRRQARKCRRFEQCSDRAGRVFRVSGSAGATISRHPPEKRGLPLQLLLLGQSLRIRWRRRAPLRRQPPRIDGTNTANRVNW